MSNVREHPEGTCSQSVQELKLFWKPRWQKNNYLWGKGYCKPPHWRAWNSIVSHMVCGSIINICELYFSTQKGWRLNLFRGLLWVNVKDECPGNQQILGNQHWELLSLGPQWSRSVVQGTFSFTKLHSRLETKLQMITSGLCNPIKFFTTLVSRWEQPFQMGVYKDTTVLSVVQSQLPV